MAEDNKNETKDAATVKATAAKRDEAASAKAAAAAEKRNEALDKEADFEPATNLSSSGAMIEEGAKDQVDFDHPAVDNNPRAGTTVRQNAIDFNDPSLSVEEAVEANLDAQRG